MTPSTACRVEQSMIYGSKLCRYSSDGGAERANEPMKPPARGGSQVLLVLMTTMRVPLW